MTVVYILRAYEANEGQYFCGVYSSLDKALVAKASLPKFDYRFYQIDPILLDDSAILRY